MAGWRIGGAAGPAERITTVCIVVSIEGEPFLLGPILRGQSIRKEGKDRVWIGIRCAKILLRDAELPIATAARLFYDRAHRIRGQGEIGEFGTG